MKRLFQSKSYCHTAHFRLRDFVDTDLTDFKSLYSDPEIVRFTHNGKFPDPVEVKNMLGRILKYNQANEDYGYAAIEGKSSGEFVGWLSLKPLEEFGIQAGIVLLKKYWGAGHATELSKILIDYAFTELRLPKIVAVVDPANSKSKGMVAKFGFFYAYDGQMKYAPDAEPVKFEIYEMVNPKN